MILFYNKLYNKKGWYLSYFAHTLNIIISQKDEILFNKIIKQLIILSISFNLYNTIKKEKEKF